MPPKTRPSSQSAQENTPENSTTSPGRQPRFLLPSLGADAALGQTAVTSIVLPQAIVHHASHVLRLKHGSAIRLWNGQGQEWSAQLQMAGPQCTAQLQGPARSLSHHELPHPVHVLQALPEGDKMDWILEKCTELGATHLWPVAGQRSVVKLSGERLLKRWQHWQGVLVAAALQSERGCLPSLQGQPNTTQAPQGQNHDTSRDKSPDKNQAMRLPTLAQALQLLASLHPATTVLCLSPQGLQSLGSWVQAVRAQGSGHGASGQALAILVGPEGGWSADELHAAQSHGANLVHMGPRILRTETAALAALAQIAGLSGWV